MDETAQTLRIMKHKILDALGEIAPSERPAKTDAGNKAVSAKAARAARKRNASAAA